MDAAIVCSHAAIIFGYLLWNTYLAKGTKLMADNVDQAKNVHFRQIERNVLLLDRPRVVKVAPTPESCLYHGRLICVLQWRFYDYLSIVTRDFTHGFPRL